MEVVVVLVEEEQEEEQQKGRRAGTGGCGGGTAACRHLKQTKMWFKTRVARTRKSSMFCVCECITSDAETEFQ